MIALPKASASALPRSAIRTRTGCESVKLLAQAFLHQGLTMHLFHYALMYACLMHYALPLHNLVDDQGCCRTPCEVLTGKKPSVRKFRMFG